MKVYARLALALLSCATALVLATGAAAAHTANHASTAVEALVVEPAETGEVAADNVQSQLNDQTPAVAQTEEEDDTDEEGPDEDGEVENLVLDHQPAAGAPGTHANAGVTGASEKAEGTDD